MNPIATFEKVSKEQFVNDCMKLNDKIGTLYLNTASETYESIWEEIQLPKRSTTGAAGYDFYAPSLFVIEEEKEIIIPTGIRCKIDPSYVLMLFPRSSYGCKYGMRLANTVGVVDSDYYNADNEGHIMVYVSVKEPLCIHHNDRFVQGIFLPYGIADEDEITNKRSGGFGSTGS